MSIRVAGGELMNGNEAYWHCLGDPLNRAVLDRDGAPHFLVTKAWGPGLTQPSTFGSVEAFSDEVAPYKPVPKSEVIA